MLAAALETNPTVTLWSPELLFAAVPGRMVSSKPFDVAPDGRFLSFQLDAGDSRPIAIENFAEELKRLVPTE